MGAGPSIQLEDVRFRWGRDLPPCLELARLQVDTGEKVFLHGPSGSGKSTLIGILSAVLRPESGRVQILGQLLDELGGAARDRFRGDHVGLVFQQFNLVPYLPVLENVLLPCRFAARRRMRALSGGASLEGAAAQLLGCLDIDEALWRRPAGQLSVGQQQRVAACRALIGRPELVIADEPTSALDEGRQEAFLDLLLKQCADHGATLLFCSHDRRLETRFDRVLDLRQLNHGLDGAAG